MGKTSTGLHIVHHLDVVHRFVHHRYFVACDAITTSDALATTVLCSVPVLNVEIRTNGVLHVFGLQLYHIC